MFLYFSFTRPWGQINFLPPRFRGPCTHACMLEWNVGNQKDCAQGGGGGLNSFPRFHFVRPYYSFWQASS